MSSVSWQKAPCWFLCSIPGCSWRPDRGARGAVCRPRSRLLGRVEVVWLPWSQAGLRSQPLPGYSSGLITAGSWPTPLSQTIPPASCSLGEKNVLTFKMKTLHLKHDWLPLLKQKCGPNRACPERNTWVLKTENHVLLVVNDNIHGCFQITLRPFAVGRLTTFTIY